LKGKVGQNKGGAVTGHTPSSSPQRPHASQTMEVRTEKKRKKLTVGRGDDRVPAVVSQGEKG